LIRSRRLAILLITFAVSALLLGAGTAQAVDTSLSARSAAYRDALGELPAMQNSDGGYGPLVWRTNATAPTTARTTEAALQTLFSAHLRLIEDGDPYRTHRNYDGNEVSLAASNVSSVLTWLRTYDADNGTQLTPGERALVAIAYHGLGDDGNARRILLTLIEEESAGNPLDKVDAAQLIIADRIVAPATNNTQNLTLAQLGARINATHYEDLDGLAWGLIAQPDHSERRAALIAHLDEADGLTKAELALGAWALAESGGPDEATNAALVRSYANAPSGLAQVYHLLAERSAYPAMSPLSTTPLFEEGTLNRVTGARDSRPTASVTQEAYNALLEENAALKETIARDEPQAFPVPTWLMAGSLLFVIGMVVVVGLAYGLKRENLTGSRKDIFEYIEAHPGEHFSKIRRDLNLAPGTFQHHLSVLESEGWITSYRDSRYKRYFVNGNRYQKLIAGYTYKQKFAALANDTTRTFVRFVQLNPGVTQKQVAARLQIHASTVNWHANRLKQAGILQDERVGKEVRYTVDEDTVEKMLKQEKQHAVEIAS
jgi:predicted transcriptional regulator